jgi:alkylhydroperoxidase family enzyme
MTDHELEEARNERSDDPKSDAALSLTRQLITHKGDISDAALAEVRAAGLTDAEIAEIVANVALNTFTNYFNLLAKTEVDFPKIKTAFPV